MTNNTVVSPTEDRIVTEHRQTHERYTTLYKGVAAHLPGFTFEVAEVDQSWYGPQYRYWLKDAEGHRITLSFASGAAGRGKVHVSGYWPQNEEHGRWTAPHDVREESPSINVSLERGYELIAKDIMRRFLPEYVRIYGRLLEKIAADNAYQDKKAAGWAKIVAAGVVVNPRERSGGDQCADARIGTPGAFDYDKGYGTVTMSGDDSVTLELRSLPVETAIRVLRALKGEL